MSVAKIWAVICASVACATAYNSTLHPPKALFRPEPGKSISYPRIVELPDGTILTTASYSSRLDRMNYFPVFSSSDGGSTWTWLSNLTDQANGQGLSAQPALAVLPEDMGDFPQGTVLASGLSTSNFSSVIDLYASLDQGVTWQFVSNVARGSGPGIQNGNPCIWEPFILCVPAPTALPHFIHILRPFSSVPERSGLTVAAGTLMTLLVSFTPTRGTLCTDRSSLTRSPQTW